MNRRSVAWPRDRSTTVGARQRLVNLGYWWGVITAVCIRSAYEDWRGKAAALVAVRDEWVDTRWWMWMLALAVASVVILIRAGFHKRDPRLTITVTKNIGGQPTPVRVIDADLIEVVEGDNVKDIKV